ncbi:MAG: putative CoA-binding protein [halophilic archaeon J07HX5]|jgi:Predicted CoA-binding protein|nr:MAG: putative CoA-binding protein [halophilic archaeon J07HX5]
MPLQSDTELRAVLQRTTTIAVVGCSSTPGKAAHEIPRFLHEHGYQIAPVNPYANAIFGIDAVDSLAELTGQIDLVNVFRPAAEVPDIVDTVLEREDVATVWLQRGIVHDAAASRVETTGRAVVQDQCMKVEYKRLIG